MSMLLDGDSPQESVDCSYELLCAVRGKFLCGAVARRRAIESLRKIGLQVEDGSSYIDSITNARYSLAFDLTSILLDKTQPDPPRFWSSAAMERTASEAISALPDLHGRLARRPDPSPADLRRALSVGTALVDIVAWDRLERARP